MERATLNMWVCPRSSYGATAPHCSDMCNFPVVCQRPMGWRSSTTRSGTAGTAAAPFNLGRTATHEVAIGSICITSGPSGRHTATAKGKLWDADLPAGYLQ
jgi:hypothetical protein